MLCPSMGLACCHVSNDYIICTSTVLRKASAFQSIYTRLQSTHALCTSLFTINTVLQSSSVSARLRHYRQFTTLITMQFFATVALLATVAVAAPAAPAAPSPTAESGCSVIKCAAALGPAGFACVASALQEGLDPMTDLPCILSIINDFENPPAACEACLSEL